MNRNLVLSALLAGAALSAGPVAAQSRNSGLLVNVHLSGASLGGTVEDAEMESGGGLGVTLGYGFNDRVTLFLNVDANTMEYREGADVDSDDGEYTLGTGDLGLRINFGDELRRLRPYLVVAFAGVSVVDQAEGSEIMIGGPGLTIGGGLQYFLSPAFAVDGAFNFSTGSFTSVDIDGEQEDLDEGIGYNHGRLHLGISWHP